MHLHVILVHHLPGFHHPVRGRDPAALHLLRGHPHGGVDHILHMQGHGDRLGGEKLNKFQETNSCAS